MSFKDIHGQSEVINLLKSSIKKNRIAQAYLFYGEAGTGKYLTAFNFAKAINCNKRKSDSCDVCRNCKKIRNLNFPDLFIVNLEGDNSSVKIDEIRELQAFISLKSYQALWKVCIIRDADRMTPQAQNSLLKSLEDASKGTVIILTCSRLQKMFPTVISRCQLVKFKLLDDHILKEILSKRISLRKEKLSHIVSLSEGSLEKAFNLANSEFFSKRNKLIDILEKSKKDLLFFLPEYKNREEILDVLDIIINWYHDLYLIKNNLKYYIINKDRISVLQKEAKELNTEEISSAIEELIKTKENIINNANIRLNLQNSVIKLCEIEGVI